MDIASNERFSFWISTYCPGDGQSRKIPIPGECELCGNRIPVARLNALPYATACIECQRAAETGGGANGQGGDWSRVLDTGYSDVDVSFSDLET